VFRISRKTGYSSIIDCHSFPNRPLQIDSDQSPDRPDICIGAEKFHAPDCFIDTLRSNLESAGLSVAVTEQAGK
jgi:hypothetical protein